MSLGQLKVMSAIGLAAPPRSAACAARTGAHERIAYNSCRNPPLPEVPGRRGAAMARRPPSLQLPAGSLLSTVVFTLRRPRSEGRRRVPEQRAAVYDLLFRTCRRDADHPRRRPEASGRAHRPHRRAAPAHAWGSALTHHRHVHVIGAWRRPVAGRGALDRLQARLLPARARAGRVSSAGSFSKASPRSTRPAAWPSSATSPRSTEKSAPSSAVLDGERAGPSGSSTPSGPSPDPRPFSPISRATPTASPSPTPGGPHRARRQGRHLQMERLPDLGKAATGSRP